ncbi:MAG: OmpH family outer membrane protein [Burkholderiales bacterium]|nr:OmpH family outer membrane protein [Burkholderiales bacterium]
MKSAFKTLLTTSLLAIAAVAPAQELKIGYVNVDRVLRDASPAKAAQAKLEVELKRREKELGELEQRLKSVSDKFERDAPTLSDSERARRQRDLVDQDREFQRKRREVQEDLSQRKNEELASVLDRTNRAIKSIFEQEKYDLIVEQAVFANSRVDITDRVIKALNSAPAK